MIILLFFTFCIHAGPGSPNSSSFVHDFTDSSQTTAILSQEVFEHQDNNLDIAVHANFSIGQYSLAASKLEMTEDVFCVLEDWINISDDEKIERLTKGIKIINYEKDEDRRIYIFILRGVLNDLCKVTKNYSYFEHAYQIFEKVVNIICDQTSFDTTQEEYQTRFEILDTDQEYNMFLMQKNTALHHKLIKRLINNCDVSPNSAYEAFFYDSLINHMQGFYINDFSILIKLSQYIKSRVSVNKVSSNNDFIYDQEFKKMLNECIKYFPCIGDEAPSIIPIYILLFEMKFAVQLHYKLKDYDLWKQIIRDSLYQSSLNFDSAINFKLALQNIIYNLNDYGINKLKQIVQKTHFSKKVADQAKHTLLSESNQMTVSGDDQYVKEGESEVEQIEISRDDLLREEHQSEVNLSSEADKMKVSSEAEQMKVSGDDQYVKEGEVNSQKEVSLASQQDITETLHEEMECIESSANVQDLHNESGNTNVYSSAWGKSKSLKTVNIPEVTNESSRKCELRSRLGESKSDIDQNWRKQHNDDSFAVKGTRFTNKTCKIKWKGPGLHYADNLPMCYEKNLGYIESKVSNIDQTELHPFKH